MLKIFTMTTKDRLKEFLSAKNIGRNKFEFQIGVSRGYLSTKSEIISSEVIEKTVDIFPDLNLEWLITGRGEMLKSEVSQTIGDITNSTSVGNNINGSGNQVSASSAMEQEYIKLLKKKDEQIDRLISIIEKIQIQ